MNKIEKEILIDIFKLNVGLLDGVSALKFRAERHEYLDLLDRLEMKRFIERRDNKYLISLSSLIEIDDVNEVIALLDLCELIFQYLRKLYIKKPGEQISIGDISKAIDVSRLDVDRAFYYLDQTDVLGGHSTHFNTAEAWCVPAERILRVKCFKEAIRKIPEEVDSPYPYGDSYFLSEALSFFDKNPNSPDFISLSRIENLRKINVTEYDLLRLIRICEEINSNYCSMNYLATGALLRILLDHIPPLLGFKTFKEVASNYPAKSLKGTFQHLENGCRNISDGILHQTIRRKESLPTKQQVNYSSDIDVLLGEIIRKLEESKGAKSP
jgi:hypothetical protein